MSTRPLSRQLAWADLEFGLFCHFGPNTFLDQEWGTGGEDPAIVNPTECDPRQWAAAAREAGMRYLVVTAKHHDGFCNWPTDTTEHSIKASPYRDGKGDIVAQVAEACRETGLAFGVYCSPWDRHDPRYLGDPAAYDGAYLAQWRELLTRYGPVTCCWLDGAGSTGHPYNWEAILGQIRELQPEACVFNMGEPDYRWAGNEDGLAPDPCWNCLREPDPCMGGVEFYTRRFWEGFPHWLPAECDARIRANWFWNSYDLPTLKSTERLVDLYDKSVGHGCNLLLNIGPDPRGLLPEPDVARLGEMGQELRRRFASPLGVATAAGELDPALGAVGEGGVQAAPDGSAVGSGQEGSLEVRFLEPTAVNQVVIQEDLHEGEHVREYAVHVLHRGRWEGVYVGTAIGHKKIDTFPAITAEAVRVHLSRREGPARLRSLAVYRV